MQLLNSFYIGILLALTVFSYGFVDPNFPVTPPGVLHELVYTHRAVATGIYCGLVSAQFIWFIILVHRIRQKNVNSSSLWKLILVTMGILVMSFPGFSYDIFNYIATARVLFTYGENPYVVMPVELPNDPMLAFMHAANKTALYGLSWIVLTSVPHSLSFNSPVIAVFTFKIFVAVFYIGSSYLVWLLSKKHPLSLALFSLNPLVVIETLVSSHNDVVMMFFTLLAFYLVQKKLPILGAFSLVLSIGIKFATGALIPIFAWVVYRYFHNKHIPWETVWVYSTFAMTCMVILSPLREEVYSWYFIWPLTIVALLPNRTTMQYISIAFSYGLLLRFAPFILTRNWFGTTPTIKYIVTAAPLIVVSLWRLIYRK